MITCPFCEKEIEDTSKYCPHCGKDVSIEPEKKDEKKETKDDGKMDALLAGIEKLTKLAEKPAEKKDIHGAEFPDGSTLKVGKTSEERDPTGGFGPGEEGWGNFCKAVLMAGNRISYDKRLYAWQGKAEFWENAKADKDLSVGVGAAGGFLVPPDFRPQLVMRSLEKAVVRPRATVINANVGDTVTIPTINDASHAASVYGGCVAYWQAEGAAKTESQPEFAQIELTAEELIMYTETTDRLLKFSAIGLGQLMAKLFGDALAYYEDLAFIQGNGVGQPLGVLNSACLITSPCEVGQAANTIIAENIEEMMTDFWPPSMGSGTFTITPAARRQLMQMSHVVGTGGQLVWMPDFRATPNPLTRPVLAGEQVVFSEKMNALGTVGDCLLVDWKEYWIADFGGIEISASQHFRFQNNITAWRAVHYVDGQPGWLSALTLRDGVNLVSPFVVLGINDPLGVPTR